MSALTDAYAILKSGTVWSSNGRCKGYATSNPGEAAKIDAYVSALDTWTPGKTPPAVPALATATGRGLVGMLAAIAAKTPLAPTPAPFTVAVSGGTKSGGKLHATVATP